MADFDHRQPKKRSWRKLATPVLLGFCLASICFAAAYISCQPIRKGEEPFTSTSLQALTGEQTALFNETLNGIGRVEAASIELKSLGIAPAINDKTEQDIRDGMNAANCNILLSRTTAQSGPRESTLIITGVTCPLTANFLSKYEAGTKSGSFSFVGKFKITDEILKTKNGVTEISLTGTGSNSVSNTRIANNTEVEGDVITLTNGKVHFSMSNQMITNISGSGTNVEGTRLIRLTFPAINGKEAFKAEVSVTFDITNSQDQSRYQINGTQISKAEFEAYWQRLGIIGL